MKGKTFREPVFNGVVNGKVTQFRKIINPQPENIEIPEEGFINFHDKYCFGRQRRLRQRLEYRYDNNGTPYQHQSEEIDVDFIYFPVEPRFKPGETVYLKEPYFIAYNDEIIFKYGNEYENIRWGNKIFMPVEYARYFIEITGVKAERLQDISDEDCLKVGIVKDFIIPAWAIGEHYVATYYYEGIGRFDGWDTPREAYAALIDEINGQGTWRSNPWMWVYDFKPIYISNQDKHD